jgi:hypothetical protein
LNLEIKEVEMTLEQLLDRVGKYLMDTAGLVYDREMLTEFVRHALSVYNRACPQTRRAEVSLEAGAREASLAGLACMVDVLDVSCAGKPVEGWTCNRDGTHAVLFLGQAVPDAAALTVHYSLPHSIAGLDEAEQTTLPVCDESLLARGAAGYAACGRAGRRAQGFDPQPGGQMDLTRWGQALLGDFRRELHSRRSREGTVAVWV